MSDGPRTSQVFFAAFFASLIGGAIGAGFAVSYLASENERTTAQASATAEARRRAIEEEARRVDEERRRLEEALRRAEQERRKLQDDARRKAEEEKRRAEEEAKRRAEEGRRAEAERRRLQEEARKHVEEEEAKRRNPGAAKASCEFAAPALKDVFAHETDCYFLQRTFRLAIETAVDGGEPSSWTNVRSGSSGTIKILATEKRADGVMCRTFEQTVTIEGKTMTGSGKACFKDGAWRIEA